MLVLLCLFAVGTAQETSFSLTADFPKVPVYSGSYGYDLGTTWDGKSTTPFFFSVAVPDGNYRVTVTLGSRKRAASTTVRCESRRLYVENCATKKGETVTRTFVVNKRCDTFVDENGKEQHVHLNDREKGRLTWDDKLTFEITGDAPAIQRIQIETDTKVPTLFVCGNSTVVDQSYEPWCSWGQMIPRFISDSIAIANHAESGLSVTTLFSHKRWAKVLSQLCKGDYVLLEFGHNDQKLDGKNPGSGAYYIFSYQVKQILDQCREKGATLILCTPTMRRSFEGNVVVNTHKDYPECIRGIAQREGVYLIDLQKLTGHFYEAMGPEKSTRAFVHYPAGTWPGQEKALADNTHFNPYGAYEIAKMVANGLLHSPLPLAKFVSVEVKDFDPSHPDDVETFHWTPSTFTDIEKPLGN